MGNQGNIVEIGKRCSRTLERSQWSGENASFSGLYRLQHQDHFVQKELLIVKGSSLPFCPACGNTIEFRLTRQVEHIDEDPDFQHSKSG